LLAYHRMCISEERGDAVNKKMFGLLLALILATSVVLAAACGDGNGTGAGTETTAASAGTETSQGATDTTKQAENTGNRKVIRWNTPHPSADPVTVPQEEFVAAFNAAQDEYVIELHTSGAIMEMGDQFDGLQSKAIEVAEWPVAVFGSIVPEFNLAELPFAVNSIEADAAYNQLMHPIYAAACEPYNMKPVFVFTCQGLDVVSTQEVKTLEDWKGLLCQTISPVTAKVVQLLGGSGVAMDFSEGYQGLQKKVIDATLQSGTFVNMFKLYEVADYVTRGYLTPAAIAVFINLDVYNSFPDHIKTIWDDLAAKTEADTNARMIEFYYSALEEMKENGMVTYNLPAAERERWAEKLEPYAEELLGKVDVSIAEQVRQITKDLDEQYPYSDK
jgi:TRAP-type C4-dicarboxylate transport system substrate-binding protein